MVIYYIGPTFTDYESCFSKTLFWGEHRIHQFSPLGTPTSCTGLRGLRSSHSTFPTQFPSDVLARMADAGPST